MSEEKNHKNQPNSDGDLPSEASLIDEINKLNLLNPQRLVKNKSEVKSKYEFWDTQPVLKLDEITDLNESIEPNKDVSEIRNECYTLPSAFYWDDVCIDDETQLAELYTLLNENYVEDDDNMFRFDYSPLFLKWALQPPGWRPEWYAGIRVCGNKKLVGFISAVPSTVMVYDKCVKMVEINFLCVHKKLRSKRVAPVLIREITRRVNKQGIFQAVYTGGVLLPKPVATCMYWHRSINPKKLIECNFSQLNNKMTMKRTVKLYKLPDAPEIPGFRPLKKEDCPQAFKLVNDYLSKFKLRAKFGNLEEFKHWFLPRSKIISTFVVEQPGGTISDLCSYYCLPSSVINNAHHSKLFAAYSFYNVASEKTGWTALMRDALIQAKKEGFDVFNALDVMDNKQFLKELKFGPGDGQLHYYLYNWQCPQMLAPDVALVLQ